MGRLKEEILTKTNGSLDGLCEQNSFNIRTDEMLISVSREKSYITFNIQFPIRDRKQQ